MRTLIALLGAGLLVVTGVFATGCAAKPLASTSYRAVAVADGSHAIAPAMDAAVLAERFGRPDLEPMIGLKITVATEQLRNPLSDLAAQALVDHLVADVSTLAKGTR